MMTDLQLVIETSARGGQVGLASGNRVLARRTLDPARRHNRDLAPAVQSLLAEWQAMPAAVGEVLVSWGPGSFTGLRVGVVSAKVFAFAVGCRLVPVPTFLALAHDVPPPANRVEVIADGLQGLVYAQRFQRTATGWESANELKLKPIPEWAAELVPESTVTGPALHLVEMHLAGEMNRHVALAPPLEALVAAGATCAAAPDAFQLEPLYLRPSSAEEQAARAQTGRYLPGIGLGGASDRG